MSVEMTCKNCGENYGAGRPYCQYCGRRDGAPPPRATKEERASLYGRPELRKRGWTPSLMKKFLPEPDRLGVGPMDGHTWLAVRIEKIESTAEWQSAHARAVIRQRAAKRGGDDREFTA